jgi:hypothetical protein
MQYLRLDSSNGGDKWVVIKQSQILPTFHEASCRRVTSYINPLPPLPLNHDGPRDKCILSVCVALYRFVI